MTSGLEGLAASTFRALHPYWTTLNVAITTSKILYAFTNFCGGHIPVEDNVLFKSMSS